MIVCPRKRTLLGEVVLDMVKNKDLKEAICSSLEEESIDSLIQHCKNL